MQHMGKTISPLSGKIERNLDLAKNSIDMLEMLQKKTAGNLSDDERKMLDHFLFDLRMNYVEETKKGDTKEEPEKADTKDKGEESRTTGGEEKEPDSEAADQDKKNEPPAEGSEK
jgi:hypothetical protein